MKPFVLTPRAEQDVSEIWDYIADDGVPDCQPGVERLAKALSKLANAPGSGHMREE